MTGLQINLFKPMDGFETTLLDATPFLKEGAKIKLCQTFTLLGSLLKPVKGFPIVTVDTYPIEINGSKVGLGNRISLTGCLAELFKDRSRTFLAVLFLSPSIDRACQQYEQTKRPNTPSDYPHDRPSDCPSDQI